MPDSPAHRRKRVPPPASELDDVCRCNFDEVDERDLFERREDLCEDDFIPAPCLDCGGRVLWRPPPVWMVEEEDDC
jgi:hypothetical protein